MKQTSNCCDAAIIMADHNGHGKCNDCKENCTPYKDDTKSTVEKIAAESLCYHDIRNPNGMGQHTLDLYTEKELKELKKACSCDNCFYGRTDLAEIILQQQKEVIKFDYFIFGADACEEYENGGVDQLIDWLNAEDEYNTVATYKWSQKDSNIYDLLSTFEGVSAYCTITEEEYNKIENV